MTKLKNPLLSLDATGSLSDSLTFTRRRGINIAERKPRLPYFLTLPVQYQRWLYQDYAYYWTTQSPAIKQTYASAGVPFHLTGFQYWMKYHLTNLPDIIGWWKSDLVQAGLTPDASLNNYPGTIIGCTPVTGIIGDALLYDGLNDEVDFGDHPIHELQKNFTIEAIIKLTTPGAAVRAGILVHINAAYTRGFALAFSAGVVGGVSWYDRNWGWRNSPIAVNDGLPHHISARFSTDWVYLTVDGIPAGDWTAFQPRLNPGLSMLAGYDRFPPGRFGGIIDNIIIHDRFLDNTEILRNSKRRFP